MNNEKCEHFCAFALSLYLTHVPPTPYPKSRSLAELLEQEVGGMGVYRHFTCHVFSGYLLL